MAKIVYYVAVTLDGFICAEDGGIEGFSHDEKLVAHYQKALTDYSCTIMGKATYEFGYQYGLPLGAKAYPHMDHYIFSKSIELPESAQVEAVRDDWPAKLRELKASAKTDIYLCGGSEFAGYVLDQGLIDEVILKVNPFCLGKGKPLFSSAKNVTMRHEASKFFDCGVIESRYSLLP